MTTGCSNINWSLASLLMRRGENIPCVTYVWTCAMHTCTCACTCTYMHIRTFLYRPQTITPNTFPPHNPLWCTPLIPSPPSTFRNTLSSFSFLSLAYSLLPLHPHTYCLIHSLSTPANCEFNNCMSHVLSASTYVLNQYLRSNFCKLQKYLQFAINWILQLKPVIGNVSVWTGHPYLTSPCSWLIFYNNLNAFKKRWNAVSKLVYWSKS